MPSNRSFLIFACNGIGRTALMFFMTGSLLAAQNFRVFTEPLIIPERGEVTQYVLLAGTNKFTFLPPLNWNVRPDAAEKTITLMPVDLSASISLKIQLEQSGTTNTPTVGAELASPVSLQKIKMDGWRHQIAVRYPDATIIEEFNCYTCGNEGLAFDLEQNRGQKISRSLRVAFLPFPGGIVEFNLSTATKNFADYNFAIGNLLTSFRIEPVTLPK